MAHLFQSDRVVYLCSCNAFKPICRLYFCRHCLKLRCGDCVSHEADSHYCPNCLENMPSAEARLKKNRCANCFDCPSCKHALSTRATSIQVPNPEDNSKTIPKKVYYLVCAFCRWTSRDVGLKDQNVASGGWHELENAESKRINVLLEHYRAMAQQEKIEKERKKFTRRRNYHNFSDKYGLSAVVARKRAGLPPISNLSLKEDDAKALEMAPAEASEEVEDFPSFLLTSPVSLPLVCTMSQRLSQPEFQPSVTADLYPRHKHLSIKRSQRCRECEHNLSKPEFNPTSIKFKIQLAAYYHVPEIRMMSIPALEPGKSCKAIMTLTNPTGHGMQVILKNSEATQDEVSSAEMIFPKKELHVLARDDTAEFDDITDNVGLRDDPEIVAFRKANKLGVYVGLKPLLKQGEVKTTMILRYDYLNTMPLAQGDLKEPQVTWLEHTVVINFGNIQSPA